MTPPLVVLLCGIAGSGKTTYARTLESAGYVRLSVDEEIWRRAARDEYKALIERAGGRWRLVYLRASPSVLRERLAARRERGDANAFPVTEATLARYLREFEAPDGEGEEIIDAVLS